MRSIRTVEHEMSMNIIESMRRVFKCPYVSYPLVSGTYLYKYSAQCTCERIFILHTSTYVVKWRRSYRNILSLLFLLSFPPRNLYNYNIYNNKRVIPLIRFTSIEYCSIIN